MEGARRDLWTRGSKARDASLTQNVFGIPVPRMAKTLVPQLGQTIFWYISGMGMFRKKPTTHQKPTIIHTARWNGNAATFFINSDGVSWSYDTAPNPLIDDTNTEAALAQLQRAYHLAVTYPDAEERIMSLWRALGAEVSDSMRPYFNWKPPLPGDNPSQ